jgi:drug/metabolite transporter (DMT)-like permease
VRGVLLALASAVAFGASAPAVAWLARDASAFATAACLYAGALAMALVPTRPDGPPLARADVPLLLFVGALGGALAPACLAWGLVHAGATSGALALNVEAVFTIVLARLIHREVVGGRVVMAAVLVIASGGLLPLRGPSLDLRVGAGLGMVVLATLGWATDSVLSRRFAKRDSREVVRAKSVVGVMLSLAIAFALGARWPAPRDMAGLFVCGVVGYGLSLKLYVLAQRELGAARTGSIFGFAPFAGAAIGFGAGDRHGPLTLVLSAVFGGAGVALLASERRRASVAVEAT